MTKVFNTEGTCKPKNHYMVDITDRLEKIKTLVDNGKYFIINRPRQYGKTTVLDALQQYLKEEYIVIPLDFQLISHEEFKDSRTFSCALISVLKLVVENEYAPISGLDNSLIAEMEKEAESNEYFGLDDLFIYLNQLCDRADKPVVLLLDETDHALYYPVFLELLGQLRAYYQRKSTFPTFQSVIFAGIDDISYISSYAMSSNYIPWNIATPFHVDLSFHVKDIEDMLQEYENDHHTGMNIPEVSQMIYDSTGGYPFLVSRLCKIIDQQLYKDWSMQGFTKAENILAHEDNFLFHSINDEFETYPELKKMLKKMLLEGQVYPYESAIPAISQAIKFGIVKEADGLATIAGSAIEKRLYNYFFAEEENNKFLKNHSLNTSDFSRTII